MTRRGLAVSFLAHSVYGAFLRVQICWDEESGKKFARRSRARRNGQLENSEGGKAVVEGESATPK
jgi:hypothetical protein